MKTRSGRDEVHDSISGLNTVRDVARDRVDPRSIWCGAYFFEATSAHPAALFAVIRDGLASYPVKRPVVPPLQPPPLGPDLFCAGSDLIYRLDHGVAEDLRVSVSASQLHGFRCKGIANALFVADLLDHIAIQRGLPDAGFADFASVQDLEVIESDTAG